MSAMLLIILGGIIALGFLGNLFSERTRMPDLLLLIGIGLLLGPVLKIIPPEAVRPFMPTFGAIALTIILFEGGLDLDLRHTLRQAGRALLLAALSFGLAMLLAYYALLLGTGRHDRVIWAFAAALACTSAPIVIPVLARVLPRSPMRPLLAVESALSDALAVIVVLLLLHLEDAPFAGAAFAGQMGRSFLIGAATAVVVGLIWLWLLSRFHARKYFYLMTIGVVFLMMGGVERFHGSGALAVLIFGILLANGPVLAGLVSRTAAARLESAAGEGRTLHARITESHAELSLVTRTFFFIYLGAIFRWPGSEQRVWLSILLITVGLLLGREIAVQILGWSTRVVARDRRVLAAMLPRGLATAVLTALVVSSMGSGETEWETIATFVVVLTNVWMTLRLFKLREEAPAAAKGGL